LENSLENAMWLKGSGQAVLGNFSSEQKVIELTKMSKKNSNKTQESQAGKWMDKTGEE